MDTELAQVVSAIETLYSPSTAPSFQSQIQSQLLSVQASQLGWSLVAPFLVHPEPTVRFFGASTLETKLSKQWDELPNPDQQALKDSLLGWLSESARKAYPAEEGARELVGEKPVLRKLSSAVVTYAIKRHSGSTGTRSRNDGEGQEAWEDWLLEVVVRLAASRSRREAVLEVLAIVIEQVQRAELPGTKRMSFMSSLSSSTPHLVQTLTDSLTISPTTSPTESVLALSCFNSYLSAGQLSHADLTILYPLLISHLTNPTTVVAACSATEELIERSNGYGSNAGGSGVTKFMNRQRVTQVIEGWACSDYVTNLTRSVVEEASEDVEDEPMAVFKLICTLAEYFISTYLFDSPTPATSNILVPPPLTLVSPPIHTLLALLITLSTFPGHSSDSSYAINELPTGAWMALQEYGADVGFTLNGKLEEGRSEDEWQVYKGVWNALKDGLRNRAVRPTLEEFGAWPKDIRDAFRIYRNTVLIDPVQYCYYVLREEMLASLVELANQQIDLAPAEGDMDSYEDLEATLFVINGLAECVPMSSPLSDSLSSSTSSIASTSTTLTTTYLSYLFSPSLLGRLPTSPARHLSLRTTSLKLLEGYSAWFTSQPSACLLAIQFVVSSLQESKLIPQAVRSLRGLCNSNRKVLTGHVNEFVGILGGLESGIGVEKSELAKVLESVASVVQALESDRIIEPILTLSNPIIFKLDSAAQGQSLNPDEAKETCLTQLLYLTSLSKGLSTPEPDVLDLDTSFDDSGASQQSLKVLEDSRMRELRERLGRAVEATVRVWASDLEIVSAISEFIRASIAETTPSPLSLEPFLLLSLCSSALHQAPSSIWLGIGGNLLARLARDRNDRSLGDTELRSIGTLVEGMLNVVLSFHGDLSTMTENPDVVSSFLSFCTQIVRHYPSIFVVLPVHYLAAVLAFAERGLGMQEQFSLKSTIELLLLSVQQTKMASASSSAFSATLQPRTPSLVRSILLAVAGSVPRSHLVSLSELLHACLLRLPEQSRPALGELLSTPNWPNERTTQEAKTRFEKSVLSARTGRQVRQAVNDFALLARGLEGSAYGAQTGL
ncbi:uncharacterized protein JCM6883_007125 [Sporobolomyces salmoneus]|uniref:uncharacterized protein n=1 Tax=Sporobolomyces salmoneus TaxID=183962 RepID=UPI0031703748